jgi:hypothetical protein
MLTLLLSLVNIFAQPTFDSNIPVEDSGEVFWRRDQESCDRKSTVSQDWHHK